MTADYFAAIGCPVRFDINLTELEKNYFAAQRQFHPDRMVGSDALTRQAAIRRSMLVNEAYEVLKNPLRRAQHLLMLAGVSPDAARPSQELLMEVMEQREELAGVEGAESLHRLAQQNEEARRQVLDGLLQAFAKSDMKEASQLTMRLSYLVKLEDEIRARGKSLP